MNEIILTEEIVFDSKPDAVPYNYRISYKVAQICMIISLCCSGRSGCPLIKLHILSNALNTKKDKQRLLDYLNQKIIYMIVRFDPAINRAIKYAIAEKLIFQMKNGSFKLTEKGKEMVIEITRDEMLLVHEKNYLKQISTRLDQEKIDNLMSAWRYRNDENK